MDVRGGMSRRIERWSVPASLIVAIIIGLAACFLPLFESPEDLRFFGYGDSWTYYGPTSFFVDHSIHSGEFPLWNPLLLAGQPIAGNPQYLLFYPPSLLRSLLTFDPTPWRTHVGLAILQFVHVIIAGLGTYVLSRDLGVSRLGAVGAALAFTFSAALTNRVFGHMYIVYVVAWWPLSLYTLRRAMHAENFKTGLRWTLLLGAVFALSILGGAPQMAHLTGVGLLFYWFAQRLSDAIETAAPARLKAPIIRLLLDACIGVCALATSVALALASVGPTLGFSRLSSRGEGATLEFEAIGREATRNVWEILTFYAGGPNYEGLKTLSATGLVFAAVGLFSARRRAALVCAALTVLLFLSSIENSPLHRLVVFLAPFPVSSAARGVMIAALPAAVLVGLGIDVLIASPRSRRLVVPVSIAAVLGVAMAIALASELPESYVRMPLSAAALPFGASLTAVLSTARWRWTWIPGAIAIGLISTEAIVWRSAAIRQSIADAPGLWYEQSQEAVSQRPEFWSDNSRGSSRVPNTSLYRLAAAIDGRDPLILRGAADLLFPYVGNATFSRGPDAYWLAQQSNRGYLLFKRSFWLHREYAVGEIPDGSTDFPPATTAILRQRPESAVHQVELGGVPNQPYSNDTQILLVANRPATFDRNHGPTPDSPLTWKSRTAIPPEHKTLSLYYRCDAEVRLAVIARESYENSEPQIIAGVVLAPTLGTLSRVNLPLPDLGEFMVGIALEFPDESGTMTLERVELVVDLADENASIEVLRRTANTVEVELRDLPGPRVLSHMDFMYPGWHAYLDGEEVPILTAFSHFKAVEVPAGTHRVSFEFRPRIVYACVTVSVLSLVAWIALLAWTSSRSRPAEVPRTPVR